MKIQDQPTVQLEVTIKLTEAEVRALEALAGYDVEAFLKTFYTYMGRHYLEPHEHGLRSLFKAVRETLPAQLRRIDSARAMFEKTS